MYHWRWGVFLEPVPSGGVHLPRLARSLASQ